MLDLTPQPTQKTVIGEAFSAAGYQTRSQKLRSMMREAIVLGVGHPQRSRDHFIAALLTLRPYELADLLWELITPVRERLIYDLFNEVLREVRAAQIAQRPDPPSEGQRSLNFCHRGLGTVAAESSEPPSPASGPVTFTLPSGQPGPAAPAQATPPSPDAAAAAAPPPSNGQKPTAADPPRRATPPNHNFGAEFYNRIFLDRLVDGKPLRKTTIAAARAWAKPREIEGRAIRELLRDLPAEDIVGDHISDAEAELVLERVSREVEKI